METEKQALAALRARAAVLEKELSTTRGERDRLSVEVATLKQVLLKK
jgi:hypothetical protein